MEKVDTTNLKKQLEILGVESIAYLTKILAENDKQVTGNLIRSLDFKVIQDINGLMLNISAIDYFKYVDEGRKPGKMPPIKPIQSWVSKRGIIIANQTLSQTAFVIARSIGRKGIKPLRLTEKLIDNIISKKEELIKKGAVKDIQDLIDKMFISPSKKENQ